MGKYDIPEYRKTTSLASITYVWRLWGLFYNIIKDANMGEVYCVLDGLDECEEKSRKRLLSRFHKDFPGYYQTRQVIKLQNSS